MNDKILIQDILDDNYLSHYGIRGMKKGIRRWTNPDGTLTEEGKRHYGIGDGYSKYGDRHGNLTEEGKKRYGVNNLKELRPGDPALNIFTKDYQDQLKIDKLKKNGIGDGNSEESIENKKNNNLKKALIIGGSVAAAAAATAGIIAMIRRGKKMNEVINVFSGNFPGKEFSKREIVNAKRLEKELRKHDKEFQEFFDTLYKASTKIKHSEEDDNYLSHYGIKGQRWGERRFQNEDGTLTEEGKRHYGIGDGYSKYGDRHGNLTEEGKKRYGVNNLKELRPGDPALNIFTKDYQDQLKIDKLKKNGIGQDIKNMSNKEIQEAIYRKRLESQYISSVTKKANKKENDIKGFLDELAKVTKQITSKEAKDLYLHGVRKDMNEINENLKKQTQSLAKRKQLAKDSGLEENVRGFQNEIDKKTDIIKRNKEALEKIEAPEDIVNKMSEGYAPVTNKLISKALTKKEKERAANNAINNISKMSDAELKEVVDRMLLEEQYNNLINPPKPSKVEKGKEFLQTLGAILGIVLTTVTIGEMLSKFKVKEKGGKAIKKSAQVIKRGAQALKKVIRHEEEDNMYNDQNDYLSHYGVKGMQKGIRRWTNEDGTLTEEGKRHYGIGDGRDQAQKDLEKVNKNRIQNYGKFVGANQYFGRSSKGYVKTMTKEERNELYKVANANDEKKDLFRKNAKAWGLNPDKTMKALEKYKDKTLKVDRLKAETLKAHNFVNSMMDNRSDIRIAKPNTEVTYEVVASQVPSISYPGFLDQMIVSIRETYDEKGKIKTQLDSTREHTTDYLIGRALGKYKRKKQFKDQKNKGTDILTEEQNRARNDEEALKWLLSGDRLIKHK